MSKELENLVTKANNGDRIALEKVVVKIKDLIYNLSLKMLLYPEEAQDATQEILVKVITHLSTFSGKSQFTTWVYRVATNYLLNYQGKQSQKFAMPFEEYEMLIDEGQSETVRYAKNEGELALLEEEVKVSCTQGLLLCLSAIDRMVYILAEILEFDSKEGAEVLEITPENFRKKLSRARPKIRNFLSKKCGLANPANPCRCLKKIDFLSNQDIINPQKLRFAQFTNRSIDLVRQIGDLEKSVAIYRSMRGFEAPKAILNDIQAIIQAN